MVLLLFFKIAGENGSRIWKGLSSRCFHVAARLQPNPKVQLAWER